MGESHWYVKSDQHRTRVIQTGILAASYSLGQAWTISQPTMELITISSTNNIMRGRSQIGAVVAVCPLIVVEACIRYGVATVLQPDLQPLVSTEPRWTAFEFGLNTIGTD